MSRTVYRVLITVVALIVPRSVAAQPPAAPTTSTQLPSLDRSATHSGPPLSLHDAIEEALQKNPNLIALRCEYDVVRQRPAQSRFLSPPTFSAQIWQWPINTLNPLNTNMYMLMVEQEIPGRGKRDLRTAVAQKDGELAANEIALSARQTLTDVKHAYVAVLVARQAADLLTQSAKLLRQLADVSESKDATGRISQQDVLKPVVELSKIYDHALMFQEQAALASAQLNVLIGRPADAPLGALQETPPAWELPGVNALMQLALDHQPELQAARLAIERAKAELAVARSEGKADFMVQGSYMLMPRGTDAWMGQLGITWPSAPWSRGKVAARIAETTAEVSAAEARLQTVESALRLTIQKAYVKLQTAEQRATLLRTTIVPQSRQTFDVSRIGYETDRVDFFTLLENQRTLLTEQLDYVRALGDLAEARADLERAVGIDFGSSTLIVTRPPNWGR